MAVIKTNNDTASVTGLGDALNATVNFSGALMEMLATVYAYILMSAIREAVQNACDAAKRAGLSFSEGVLVKLPTPSNPMITVIDKGSGMTQKFMEDPAVGYLSYGSSTKSGDNGAAGGLGIGRWAAYGYIRECYIQTCHASDMIERTYFQFQGDNSTPKVQLASEVPGSEVGTKISFPIKDSDLSEALRAIAWLKDVMQLTMGDSFSVDSPALLPDGLPKFSGTVLSLEAYDSSLKGVLLYPMQGSALQYGRQGLTTGSLVVLTNKEAGIGGLPFHVKSPSNTESVFHTGVVVEIPMSFGVPFMPSREELKYTDEVDNLLRRIDQAAFHAVVDKARELYAEPSLTSKAELSDLLGNNEAWHWFARCTRQPSDLMEALRKVTGGEPWQGGLKVKFIKEMHNDKVSIKVTSASDPVLREALNSSGYLAVSASKGLKPVTFHPNKAIALVVNDVASGGTSRFRAWLLAQKGWQQFIFVTSAEAGLAQETADAINALFGGALTVYHTSLMPDVSRKRVVMGSSIVAVRSRGSSMTFFDCTKRKQITETMGLTTYEATEPVRVWLGKDGAALQGFNTKTTLCSLVERWSGSLISVLAALGLNRLYLLTPRQVDELAKAQAEVKADGLWELADDEFAADDEGQEALRTVTALKSWKSLEEALADAVALPDVQAVLTGKKVRSVLDSFELTQLCRALAKRPRMELTGTRLDKAMSPYLDLLTGELRLHSKADAQLNALCEGLALVGTNLEVGPDASEARLELVGTLKRLTTAGHIDYSAELSQLHDEFPMLQAISKLHTVSATAIDHLCLALAAVYH